MYFMMSHTLRPYFPFLHRPALTHTTLSYSSCGATHRSKNTFLEYLVLYLNTSYMMKSQSASAAQLALSAGYTYAR